MVSKTKASQPTPEPGKPIKLIKGSIDAITQPGIYPDTEVKGFRLRVAASGVKSYQLVGKVKGSSQTVFCTIGKHGPDLPPEKARDDALDLKELMRHGINPNEQAKQDQRAKVAARAVEDAQELAEKLTVGAAFEEFLATKRQKQSTQTVYRQVFGKHFKSWLNKPLVSVTQEDVLVLYSEIAKETESSAAHAMRIFRALFHTAQVRHGERIPGLVRLNPVKLLTHAQSGWNAVGERTDFIHDDQLPAFYKAVMELRNPVARDYILVCLFTGLRKAEACKLKWENVDLRRRTITVSSEQAKNKQQHVLMMSDFLYDLFMSRREAADGIYVFPGKTKDENGHGHYSEPKTPLTEIAQQAGIPAFSSHSLRRTFATNLDALGFELREVQRLLNHKPGSIAERHYIQRQAEKTKEPMQRVSERLLALMQAESASEQTNVVPLMKSAK